MIGIVVVTHGQFAEQLVEAARTIVGELPRAAAVSIGWSDDVSQAQAEIERAILHRAGEGMARLDGEFEADVRVALLQPLDELRQPGINNGIDGSDRDRAARRRRSARSGTATGRDAAAREAVAGPCRVRRPEHCGAHARRI